MIERLSKLFARRDKDVPRRSIGSCVPVRKGDGGSRWQGLWVRGYLGYWQGRLRRNKFGWKRYAG